MSKTNEELNKLKEEVEAVNEKLQELTEEDLEQVTGGVARINESDVATIISTVKFDTSEIKF